MPLRGIDGGSSITNTAIGYFTFLPCRRRLRIERSTRMGMGIRKAARSSPAPRLHSARRKERISCYRVRSGYCRAVQEGPKLHQQANYPA